MGKYQDRGREFEKQIGREFGAENQSCSGSHWSQPNDKRNNLFLFETKFTSDTDKYCLKYGDLEKLSNNSMRYNRTGVFIFGFHGGKHYVLLEEIDFNFINKDPCIPIELQAKGTAIFTIKKDKLKNLLKLNSVIKLLFNGSTYIILEKNRFKEIVDGFDGDRVDETK